MDIWVQCGVLHFPCMFQKLGITNVLYSYLDGCILEVHWKGWGVSLQQPFNGQYLTSRKVTFMWTLIIHLASGTVHNYWYICQVHQLWEHTFLYIRVYTYVKSSLKLKYETPVVELADTAVFIVYIILTFFHVSSVLAVYMVFVFVTWFRHTFKLLNSVSMLVFRPYHRSIQEFLYHLQQIDHGSKENRNPWLIKYYQKVSLGLRLWLSVWCQGRLKRLKHTSVSCLNPYISFYENCSLEGKDMAECKTFIS